MAVAPSHSAMLRTTNPEAWPGQMAWAQGGGAAAYRLLPNGNLPCQRQPAARLLTP
jgi:hypothetical protein